MSPSIRQQRQALRRQRRQQHQAHRKGSRRRGVSPHLGRRVRSSDLNSLDERQRRIAQAILSRRHQAQQLQEQSQTKIGDATLNELPEPSQEATVLGTNTESQPTDLTSSSDPQPSAEPIQGQ